MKQLAIIAVIFFTTVFAAEEKICGDWEPYRDEKCFKIIDATLRTFGDAEKSCAKLDNSPTLPILHSKEEQEFLVNYLFKMAKKVDNFWLGGKFVNNSFKWSDKSDLSYSNWDQKGPRSKPNYCIQIQADEASVGKWIDEPCQKANLVVCQKMQTWSLARLQKTFLDNRKEMDDTIVDLKKQLIAHQVTIGNQQTALNSHLSTINSQQTTLNSQQAALSNHLATINSQKAVIATHQSTIDRLKQNPVPVGFIYVQFPSQPKPSSIWSTVSWTEVTSTYAGLFFRAAGGGSNSFEGNAQGDNSPRLIRVHHVIGGGSWNNIDVSTNGWSPAVSTGGANGDERALNFEMSGGEVRPKNTAIRIWKRT